MDLKGTVGLGLGLRAIGLIIVVFGFISLAVAGWFLNRDRAFVARAKEVQAVVVEVRVRNSSDGDPYYYPRFRFTTQDGAVVEHNSDIGSRPASYREGDKTIVLYDPLAPEEFKEKSWFDLWGISVPLTIGAILEILLGIGFLIVSYVVTKKATTNMRPQPPVPRWN